MKITRIFWWSDLVLILFCLVMTLFPAAASSNADKDKRLDLDYAKIGDLVLKKKGQIEEFQQTLNQFAPTLSAQDYDRLSQRSFTDMAKNKSSHDFKSLVEVGKKYFESAVKKTIAPICKKFEACKNACRLEVAGDIVNALVDANPELLPVQAAFQSGVLDTILPDLKDWCGCS